jgi:hypothetical protein
MGYFPSTAAIPVAPTLPQPGSMDGMVEKTPMPVPLRVALLAVLFGSVLSAVSAGVSIIMKWDYANRHPAQDWRNDLGLDAFFVTLVLVVAWLVGTSAVVFSVSLAAKRIRAGQILLTGVLALFVVYACQATYGSADVWDKVDAGTTDPDFVNRNGFLPYLGSIRIGIDLTLFVLAVVPLVLLWLPATRRFYLTQDLRRS